MIIDDWKDFKTEKIIFNYMINASIVEENSIYNAIPYYPSWTSSYTNETLVNVLKKYKIIDKYGEDMIYREIEPFERDGLNYKNIIYINDDTYTNNLNVSDAMNIWAYWLSLQISESDRLKKILFNDIVSRFSNSINLLKAHLSFEIKEIPKFIKEYKIKATEC